MSKNKNDDPRYPPYDIEILINELEKLIKKYQQQIIKLKKAIESKKRWINFNKFVIAEEKKKLKKIKQERREE